ncbi:MAG: DEAD/DEAH box helicase [Flavobacteriaceae bacterium]|nr:MAG: DEAD/DEAH box helicase [Flavobacteriaceae bacterium]
MLTISNLHSYQLKAIDYILKEKRCLINFDMGLGKTITSLTVFSNIINKEVKKLLIVAPLNIAKNVWHNELQNWEHTKNLTYSLCIGNSKERLEALNKEVDIYIINQENIAWMYKQGFSKYGMIIVDESSCFKSHQSIRFKYLKKFTSIYMVLLTGTAIPNGYHDIWSQMYLIDQGIRLGKNISEFRNSYFSYNEYTYKYTCINSKGILDKIKDKVLVMKAEDYLNLPDKIITNYHINIDNYAIYKKFEKDFYIAINDDSITAVNAGVLTNKLLQYCNGAVYNDQKDNSYTIIHDNKIQALKELLEIYNKENILISFNFKSDEKRIKEILPKAMTIDSNNVDQISKEWNNNQIKILLCQCSTAKGLNLQKGGRIIIWFGLTYNLESYLQFNARLHRQGQNKPVLIYHLVARNCKDQELLKVLNSKDVTQEEMFKVLKNKY